MAEGGGLLNRCRGSTPTVSSNLIPSANPPIGPVHTWSQDFWWTIDFRHFPNLTDRTRSLASVFNPNITKGRSRKMPCRSNALTAAVVKNAKPGRYGDGYGLYLLVRSPAAKFWMFHYTMPDAKMREMELGWRWIG